MQKWVGVCDPRPAAIPGAAIGMQEYRLLTLAAQPPAEPRSFQAFLKTQLEGAMISALWATPGNEPAIRLTCGMEWYHPSTSNY